MNKKSLKDEEGPKHISKFLETILDHTHMLVAYMGPRFNFIKVNRAYAEADERAPSFFPGKNHFDLYPNTENERIFRKVVQSGKPFIAEAKAFEYAEHPERGTSYWDWSLIPIKEADGTVSALVLTLSNVTERILSEIAIVNAKRQWEKTFDAVPDLIMILDKRHKILRANRAMAKKLGKSPKDLVGLTCYEIVHDAKKPLELCPHSRLLEDGKEHRSDLHEEGLGGDYYITVSPIYEKDGSLQGSVHVARDITELKLSQKALQESEKKFRELADQSPNMIFINTGERVVYANRKCEELMGYTRKELYAPDFNFRKLIALESEEIIENAFKKHMKGQDVQPYEYTLITKDGERIEAINAPKLISYDGEQAILGVVTDITERVQMEKALRKSEEALRRSEHEYRAIFENTGVASLITEEDTTISLVNSEFEKLSGYSREEVENKKSWADFIMPNDMEKLRTAHDLRRLNPNAAPKHHEIHFINRNGQLKHTLITVDIIPGTQKRVASVLDISERKRLENQIRKAHEELELKVKERTEELLIANEKLRKEIEARKRVEKGLSEAEIRYRTVADFAFDWEYWLSEDDKLLYVSPSCERITGYSAGEFIKKPRLLTEIIFDEDQALWDDHHKGKNKRDVDEFQFRIHTKEGEKRWIEHACQPVIDEKGNFLGRRASQRDITSRKNIEEELTERLRFQRILSEISATFANLPISDVEVEVERGLRKIVDFLGADRGSVFEFLSESETLYSVNSYAVPGLSAYNVEIAEQVFPWILKTLLQGETIIWQDENEAITDQTSKGKPSLKKLGIKSKVSIPISVGGTLRAVISLSSLKQDFLWTDERVERIKLLGEIFANALERKKAERDAQQLRSELAHISRLSTLGVLTGSFAHEINQPLAAIMSNAQTAQRILDALEVDSEQLKEILTDIIADTSRASDVIQKLRAMIKKVEIEKKPIDINNVIEEVVSFVSKDAEAKNISIHLESDPELPHVLSDRVQLQQVMLNLLINAFEAMISQTPERRRLIIRTGMFDKNNIQVALQDEGMGIEEGKLEEIFIPFNTSKPDGMGLGLSVNQSIIESYGGRIWAENNPGNGATFYFTLPILEKVEP